MFSTVRINGITLDENSRAVFRRALEEVLALILMVDVGIFSGMQKVLEAALQRRRLLHLLNFFDTGIEGPSPEDATTFLNYDRRRKITIADLDLPDQYVAVIEVAWDIYSKMKECPPEHKKVMENFKLHLGDGKQNFEYRHMTQADLSRIHTDPPPNDGWKREVSKGVPTGRMVRELRE